jgi:hypothetical protein
MQVNEEITDAASQMLPSLKVSNHQLITFRIKETNKMILFNLYKIIDNGLSLTSVIKVVL